MLGDSASNATWKDYDAVVLAVPLNQETAIRVDGVDLAPHTGQYEQIYATFVQGEPRAATWSRSADSLPDSVLSCSSTLDYNSIGQICPVDYRKGEPFPFTGAARVWKVFSSEALDDAQLSTFFSQIREVKQVRSKRDTISHCRHDRTCRCDGLHIRSTVLCPLPDRLSFSRATCTM